MCGRLLFVPWLYVRVSLYILVSSARSAEKLVYELAQNTVLHLCGASKSYAEMWEKKFSVPGCMVVLVHIVGVVRYGAGVGYWLSQDGLRSE